MKAPPFAAKAKVPPFAAPGGTAPKKGKKKKVPNTGNMGGLLGVTAKKPEPDMNLRKKQSSARNARLAGKLI